MPELPQDLKACEDALAMAEDDVRDLILANKEKCDAETLRFAHYLSYRRAVRDCFWERLDA